MVASVGAPHPWPLAVGEVDVSTFLGLMWNYAVAGAFESRRLHPSAPTTQSALEPGPPPREPGFFLLRHEWQLPRNPQSRAAPFLLGQW
jgi:hypothetical protein